MSSKECEELLNAFITTDNLDLLPKSYIKKIKKALKHLILENIIQKDHIKDLNRIINDIAIRQQEAIEYGELIDNRNTYIEISELRHLLNLLKGDKQ